MRRWILGVLGAISAAVVALIGYAVVDQIVITPRRPVAIVDKVGIPFAQFEKTVRFRRVKFINEYQSYYQIMQYLGTQEQQYQARLDQIEAQLDDPVGIGRNTLQDLIQQELVLQEAREQGISISPADVEQQIQSFFDYDPDRSPPTPIPATDHPSTQVSPSEGPAPTPSPTSTPYTEDAFQALYSDYIDNLKADTGMSKENVEQLFELQLLTSKVRDAVTSDIITEEVHVNSRHILLGLENRDAAQDVLERVLSGEDFAELASEFSIDNMSAQDGGALGWFPRGQMVAPFETVIFDSEIGMIPALVETQFGYHIVDVLGRQMRPVSEEIVRRRRAQSFDEWMAQQRASSNIIMLDWWESQVPTEPILEQYLRGLQQRGQETVE